jgi:hypothetical protein
MARVKRSQIATYVNATSVATTSGTVYSLLGVGVASAAANMNPKTTEETYIHQDTATISLDAYAPTLPVEMTAYTEDAVFTWLDGLRVSRAVGSAAETHIIEVRLYQTSAASAYPATKQQVSVQVDNALGGDGGTPAKVSFTFNYMGDPVQGSFNPTTKVFS